MSSKGGFRIEETITASSIISFTEKLECNSSSFYRKLSELYIQDRATFLAFAKEGKKNKALITRTYQETITDAIEACFSFRGLNLRDYSAEIALIEGGDYSDALRLALDLEEKAERFYLDVAEQSRSLLATIPGAFKKVAERRKKRKIKLNSMLDDLK